MLAAQESKLQELTADIQSESGRKNYFRIARQMAREGRDVISLCCIKMEVGNVVSDAYGMKDICRKYMEKLLNVENDWDDDVDCPEVNRAPIAGHQQLGPHNTKHKHPNQSAKHHTTTNIITRHHHGV